MPIEIQQPGRRWQVLKRHETGLFVAILVVIAATALFDSQHNYWHNPQASFKQIVRQTSMLGIFALGAAVVIIAGGIDLSSGSMIAFSGTICGTILVFLAPEQMGGTERLPIWVLTAAVLGTMLSGFLVGSLHAWLITAVGLPPFVATLATLVGLRSLARAICESVTEAVMHSHSTQIQINDPFFRQLATVYWVPAALFAVLSLLMWALLSRTVVGRHLYALGGNEAAAELSGIRTARVKWLAYCLSAMLSSVAGILYICDQSVAAPQTLGMGYELNGIAAAVVGGCSLQGGIGTVPGTVLGALFLRTIIDGVQKVIKTGADVYQGLIVGVVVVFAVALTQSRQSATRRRQFFTSGLGAVTIVNLSILSGTMAALIGPKLLQGQTSLDAGYLALVAGGACLLWLLVDRMAMGDSTRRWARFGVLAFIVAAALSLDFALPGIRAASAHRAVQSLGGTVSAAASGSSAPGGLIVDISDQPVGDVELRSLVGKLVHLPGVVELRLDRTNVTDNGVESLRDLPALQRVSLEGAGVTARGMRRLSRLLPEAELIH